MYRLESSYLTVFGKSSHLSVLKTSIQNTRTKMILKGLKYSIEFIVAFSKSLYFYNHKKCHFLQEISGKKQIKAKFHKTEFDNYAICITSVYLI